MYSCCNRNGFFLIKGDIPAAKGGIDLIKSVVGYGPLGAALRSNFISEWEYSSIHISSANVHPIVSHELFTNNMVCQLKHWSNLFMMKDKPHGFAFHSCSSIGFPSLNEHMHLCYVCPTNTIRDWMLFWKRKKLKWWKQFSRCPERFLLEDSDETNMAIKYCIEEKDHLVLEDIKTHALEDHSYILHFKTNITNGLWSILTDSFLDNNRQWKENQPKPNALLLLHRRLAPIKLVFLPQENSHDQQMFCDKLTQELNLVNITATCHKEDSIESRLSYHDEIGTPSRVLLDNTTLTNGVFYLQDRDSGLSEPIESELLLYTLQKMYQRYKDS